MKTKLSSFVLAAIAGVITLLAYPAYAFNQGQCVMVKTAKLPNGYYGLTQPIQLFKDPEGKKVVHTHKPSDPMLEPFYVGKTQGQYILLVGSESIDTPDDLKGKPIAWARKADFVAQSPRNCNF